MSFRRKTRSGSIFDTNGETINNEWLWQRTCQTMEMDWSHSASQSTALHDKPWPGTLSGKRGKGKDYDREARATVIWKQPPKKLDTAETVGEICSGLE